jgi:hypothetical protein
MVDLCRRDTTTPYKQAGRCTCRRRDRHRLGRRQRSGSSARAVVPRRHASVGRGRGALVHRLGCGRADAEGDGSAVVFGVLGDVWLTSHPSGVVRRVLASGGSAPDRRVRELLEGHPRLSSTWPAVPRTSDIRAIRWNERCATRICASISSVWCSRRPTATCAWFKRCSDTPRSRRCGSMQRSPCSASGRHTVASASTSVRWPRIQRRQAGPTGVPIRLPNPTSSLCASTSPRRVTALPSKRSPG